MELSRQASARILVAEDELSMREFLQILLRRHDYEVVVAETGEQACELLDANGYDLVITDLKMPKRSGIEVLAHAKQRDPAIEVIVVTAFATAETAIAAMRQGAYDYLTKPFKVDEILVTVERALEKRALVRDNVTLREQLEGKTRLESLVGRSAPMQHLFELVRKVAQTRTSVLILGESGTGKELAARAIHAMSDRAARPFIAVNCGAIPETLIESEFYGHVRGAFTGATASKEGLFSAADGGTIFLDEIAELSPSMQVKLLRTLQERTVKPVGGVAERSIDVRIIAATNRHLDEEVATGRFRSDLFYRLNVIPMLIAPLRERREDIPILVNHFLRKFSAAQGRVPKVVSPEAMASLCSYHYPGNVRELENMIERSVTLATSDQIDMSVLPELQQRHDDAATGQLKTLPEQGLDLDAHIGAIEHTMVVQALERTNGNRTEAAQLLGITLRSLRYRLAKFGMEKPGSDSRP